MSSPPPLLVAGLALSLAVVPAQAGQRDVDLWPHVHAALHDGPHLTIFDDVSATIQDGAVTLSGKVTTDHKRAAITRLVSAVHGVRLVHDRLAVLPASAVDDELRQRIARAIYGNAGFWHYAMLSRPPIHIIVERSHVTLSGFVQRDVDRMLAEALARQVGVASISNRLQTVGEIGESGDEHD